MIALAWILFGVAVLVTVAFCWLIVRYWQDKHDSEALPTFVTIIALSVTLFCVILIPIDIYNVSSMKDVNGNVIIAETEMATRNMAFKIVYYILYSAILLLTFVVIPFAYFYYEEDDDQAPLRVKIWGGCKYTLILIAIIVVLLLVGLFLTFAKPSDKPLTNQNAIEWAKDLVGGQNMVEAAISFAVACLTVVGFVIWLTYTAFGLSALPIGMIKGFRQVVDEAQEYKNKIKEVQTEKDRIKSTYLSGNKKISKKDESKVGLLERQERVLLRQNDRLQTKNAWTKIYGAIKPFLFIFGIIFLLFSLLIVVSILLTNIDKAVNSQHFCGAQCGFVLAYPQIFNPLGVLLTKLSPYFPLDFIVIGLIILYIFFCTIAGIVKIGIRFIWIHMYSIKSRATPPQGLLLMAVILMLSILALNMEITYLAPQWATFGSQVYMNNSTRALEPCSLDAPPGDCIMTQIGTFINILSLRTNVFALIYFYATWVFVATFLIGTVISIVRRKSSNIETRDSDSEEEEEK